MYLIIGLLLVGLTVASFFAGLEWIQDATLHNRNRRKDIQEGRELTNIDAYFEQQTEKKRKTALNTLIGTLIVITIYMLMAYIVTPHSVDVEKQTMFESTSMSKKQVSPNKRVTVEHGTLKCYVTVSQYYTLRLLSSKDQTLVFDRQCSALTNEHQQAIDTLTDVYSHNLHVSVPDETMEKRTEIVRQYGGQPPSQDEDDEE